jgi:ABC-2 type transport system permease protein
VAEGAAAEAGGRLPTVQSRPSRWQAYRAVLGARLRAQTAYRGSFAIQLLANLAQGGLDFAEVNVIFHNVRALGGLDFRATLLVFALSNVSFAIADGVAGSLDEVPRLVRTGTLEVLLLRPLSLIGQIVTADIALRRFGRAGTAVVVLAVAVRLTPVDWTPSRVVLLAITPLTGAVVFVALFILAGSVQFWLVDGSEVTNAFTYGGNYAASFSAAVFPPPLRAFFAFVVPTAFVGYLPVLALLDLPGPALLPAWLGWWVPVLALLALGAASLAWWSGIRRYTGAGG